MLALNCKSVLHFNLPVLWEREENILLPRGFGIFLVFFVIL